jgi:aspartate aminotransferase
LITYNNEISQLQPSRSIAFMAQAKQMKATDPSIISLAGGEPDFDTPVKIREEVKRQLDAGYTHYTVGPGLPELRAAIAKKLREENGCNYTPEGVIVTPGGKFAIYMAVRSMVNPGDEVMYLEPGWVSYPSIIEASAAVPVPVRLTWDQDFRVTQEILEKYCSDKTKMLIINYPNNPTGRCLSMPEALEVKAFMEAHPDVLLLTDEIYERILYTGKENVSMAGFPEVADRVLTVNGFSKSVAMTGWRVGYVAAEAKLAKIMYNLFQHTMTCVSGFIQKAAVTALDCGEEVEQMRQEYERRRDMFIGALNAIDGVSCMMPEGAFYAWVKFEIPGYDSEQICDYILKHARVVGVPGVAYGTDEPCVRFSFAASWEELETAAKRIAEAMKAL